MISAPEILRCQPHQETKSLVQGSEELPDRDSGSVADDDPAEYGRWGGLAWKAYPELGFRAHSLVGEYFPRISAATPVERCQLFAELAVKMYNSHAEMRLKLVRPGKLQDVTSFDDEHGLRCDLGVWDILGRVEVNEAEKDAIEFALAGCRSSAITEAFKRVNLKNFDCAPQTDDPPSSGDDPILGRLKKPESSFVLDTGTAHGVAQALSRRQRQGLVIGKWEDLEIVFLGDHRLQLHALGNTETFNYEEIGFTDRRTSSPNKAWEILRQFAEGGGTISRSKEGCKWSAVEKAVQDLRKGLRVLFELNENPLPFIKGLGYRTCFQIRCSPSYRY